MARAVDLPAPDNDDTATRLRDGYQLVCEVRPGTRMPCPTCDLPLPVPVHAFQEVPCPHCIAKGRDGRVVAGFFELGPRLIEHLVRLDPQRDWRRRLVAEMDVRNAQRKRRRELDALSDIDAVNRDYFRHLHQIPQFGYTGRTGAWRSE